MMLDEDGKLLFGRDANPVLPFRIWLRRCTHILKKPLWSSLNWFKRRHTGITWFIMIKKVSIVYMLIIKQWPLSTNIKYKSSFVLVCVRKFHFHQEVSTANLHPFPSAAHGVGEDDEEDQGDSWGHCQGDKEVSEIVSTFQWLRRGVVLADVWQHTYARVWTVTTHWNNLSDVHLQEQRQTGLSIKTLNIVTV